jgi:hypothetical protein
LIGMPMFPPFFRQLTGLSVRAIVKQYNLWL